MELLEARKLAGRLDWLESTGSTNADLLALAASEELPDLTVVVSANQQAGRGRAGRSWETPPGKALAISVLLKPPMASAGDTNALGWLPLLGGLAMVEAVNPLLPAQSQAALKWPNDVLIGDKKLCGVLSELVPATAGSGPAVVIGAGINLTQNTEELPISNATSLELAGASLPASENQRFDLVLSAYLQRLSYWYQRLTASSLSAEGSGLRAAVIASCATLGKPARAILPDGSELIGMATTIDSTGRIVLEVAGKLTPVAAGDIVHLRH